MAVKSVPKSSKEVHVRGDEIIRTKRLGKRQLELITSDRKKEVQMDACEVIGEADFTADTEHTEQGNVICRLPVYSQMSFEKFIDKIVDLFAECIERHNARMATEPAPQQTTSRPQRTKRRSRRYHKRHHTATPTPALNRA